MGMSTYGGERRVCPNGAPATSAPVDHASRTGWERTVRLPWHGGHRPPAVRRRGTRCPTRATLGERPGLGAERAWVGSRPTAQARGRAGDGVVDELPARASGDDLQAEGVGRTARVAPVVPSIRRGSRAGRYRRSRATRRAAAVTVSRLRGQPVSPPPRPTRGVGVPVSASGGAWLERLTVVKMDTLAPHAELEHPTANGAWPRGGLHQRERPAEPTPGGAPPPRRPGSTAGRSRTAPSPPTSPSSTTRAGAGERHRDRSGEAEEVARDRGRRDAVIPLAALEVGAKSDTDAGRGRRPRSRSTGRGSGEPPAPPLLAPEWGRTTGTGLRRRRGGWSTTLPVR